MNIADVLAEKYGLALSREESDALVGAMERRVHARGTQVSELHCYDRHMFFIEEGILRQYYYKDGRNITEHFGAKGDVLFCIESLFLNLPSLQAIEAIEPSVVWALDYSAFKTLADARPGINRLYRHIMEKALVVSQHKADSWRFESSRERYKRFCREYPEVARGASVAHVASYLLMSPETLSRVRAGVL